MIGVAREPHPCWTITCDGCGCGDNPDYENHFHHASEEDAGAMSGFERVGERWLCDDCSWNERHADQETGA